QRKCWHEETGHCRDKFPHGTVLFYTFQRKRDPLSMGLRPVCLHSRSFLPSGESKSRFAGRRNAKIRCSQSRQDLFRPKRKERRYIFFLPQSAPRQCWQKAEQQRVCRKVSVFVRRSGERRVGKAVR